MGYVPVERNAGQIMYQGAMQRARTLGQTLRDIGETMYQRDQENKAFGAKLKSLESLLQTHKDKFGMSEEQVKQFLSQDPNQTPKERYLRIGSFIEDSIKMSQLQKEKAQMDLIAAQAEKTQRENALMKQDEEFFANLERMAKAGEKAPEQPSATATPQQAEAITRFATQLPKAGGQPPAGGVPAMLARGVQPTATPVGEVGGTPAPATRQRPYAGPTEQDIIEARTQLGPGASRNSIRLQANKIAEARAKSVISPGIFQTEEEAMREASRLDESLPVSGYTRAAKYDPSAKGYVLTQLPSVQTTEEKAREAALVESGKTRAANAEKYITDLSSAAAEASDDQYRLKQIRALYEEGVSTGFTSGDWFVRAQSLGAEFGLIDPKKQAKKEELIALLAQDSLTKTRTLLKGQGSVANAERERVDKISTDAKKRPEANLELVKTTDGVYKKLIAAENERMRLEDQGLNSVEVQKRVQRWWLSNKLEKFMDGGSALPSGWEEIR